ncbi:MAG: hypothetical protein FJW30_18710 [Acidobacteria bacterium]|nr:hypothetical protein [Acidobacteriota bacterium]
MPFRTIPEFGLEYALISFDDKGQERTDDPDGGLLSAKIVQKVGTLQPTHIFLFSHGWKGDFPAAVDQYNRWIGAMWKLEADRARMGAGFRPMFIGLHWPSQPWGDESFADASGSGGASFDPTAAVKAVTPANVETMFSEAVTSFGDTPEIRSALRVIFDAYKNNPNAFVVPADAAEAYQKLADAVGFTPDEEVVALDPQKAVAAGRIVEAGASFGIFGSIKKGILGGLRQVSFWMMKNRARSIGEGGMHRFVTDLMNATGARIHLMGHSFGCVVVSSILVGPQAKGKLPRPVSSVVLVQGAVSLWSWGATVKDSGTPGYFHSVLSNGSIGGPVVTTLSVNDKAVGLAYPAAVGLVGQADFVPANLPLYGGIGSFGIQGTGLEQAVQMLPSTGNYGFQAGRIYNLNSSQFIPSHSGIDGPEVAHAIWEAAL